MSMDVRRIKAEIDRPSHDDDYCRVVGDIHLPCPLCIHCGFNASQMPSPQPTASPLPTAVPVPLPTAVPQPVPTAMPSPLPSVSCASDESVYRLLLYDTGGDGWQGATFSIYSSSSVTDSLEGSVLVSGTLATGYESSEWICLSDGCYEIVVSSGTEPTEIGFKFVDEVGVGGNHAN